MIDGSLLECVQLHYEITELCMFSYYDLSVFLGFWKKSNMLKCGLGEILNPDGSNSCRFHAGTHGLMRVRHVSLFCAENYQSILKKVQTRNTVSSSLDR